MRKSLGPHPADGNRVRPLAPCLSSPGAGRREPTIPPSSSFDSGPMNSPQAPAEAPQRERILKIAAQLFATRGFHGVGMTELGDAVGLGRGALYHHIRSKEDLLYDISRDYIADLAAHAKLVVGSDRSPSERLELLGDYLIQKIAARQAELTVCFREVQSLTGVRHDEVMALHTQYEGAWKRLLQDGERRGLFRPYDPIVLKGLLGMYFYSYLWLKPSGRVGPKAIAERFNSMALKALAPR